MKREAKVRKKVDPRDMTPEERKVYRAKMAAKKRKKEKLKVGKHINAVFFIAFALGFLFMIIIPRSTVSNIEKRTLATFPTFTLGSYFSGDFTSDVDTWYTDTVPFRDTFKNIRSDLLQLCGFQTEGTYTIINKDIAEGGNKNVMEDETETTTKDSTKTTSETTTEETESTKIADGEAEQRDFRSEEAEAEMGDNSILIVQEAGHWRALPLFGGGSHDTFTESMNYLASQVGDDINIYCMPVPLSAQFYTPSNAQQYTVDEETYYQDVFATLDDRIQCLDLCQVFTKHTEEDIYMRTDHHWFPLGAYYAARTLAEAADLDFADLDKDYEKCVNEGYVGSMYGYTGDARILNDPEDFVYYLPKAKYTAYYYDGYFNYSYEGDYIIDVDTSYSYGMYMGGDTNVVKVKTSVKNGRKLFILKDSFGNPIPSFLMSTFEEIYIADVRYFELNAIEFMRAQDITDFAYICCSYYLADGSAGFFYNCLTQNSGYAIVDGAPE